MNLEQLWNSTKGILDRQKALFEKALSQVASAVMDLHAKYEELEKRAMTPGPKGDPGRDGRDGIDGKDGQSVTDEQVGAAVQKYMSANPAKDGRDGRDGIDGKDGRDAEPINIAVVVRELLSSPELKTLAELAAAEAVGEYFKANPVQHGKDGKDGRDGKDGMNGKDGSDASESQIFNSVERYLKANPPPAGKDGRDGKDGEDGRGMTGFLINRDGELVATTNKGETINLGRIVGKDGEKGKDGISYEGHMVIYDPVTHEGVIRTASGLETRFPLPGIVGKGYWREGTRAKANEAWTHDGTLWIAKRETDSKPGIGNDDWFIGARKGRDSTK